MANTTLSEYARKGLREARVVTRRGKPVLTLTPVKDDWESIAIANNPEFLAILAPLPCLAVRRQTRLSRRRAPQSVASIRSTFAMIPSA